MIALIDADIIAGRSAFAAKDKDESIACEYCFNYMTDILNYTNADRYKAFLSGTDNFRKVINPDYKLHRKLKDRPEHLEACRSYLIAQWKAEVVNGYEADDALGVAQDKVGHWEQGDHDPLFTTIICTIDKDLLQIPGLHYNFVTGHFQQVTEMQGIKHFWKQMLIGDVADNIKGVDKIGPVKAGKIIDPLQEEIDMYQAVCNLYKNVERFDSNADCLWIWHNLNEKFSDRNPWNDY